MPQVELSDALFSDLQRAADRRGQSVDAFVDSALQLYLRDEENEPFHLTPEQLARVRQAEQSVREGRLFTHEEVWDSLRKLTDPSAAA